MSRSSEGVLRNAGKVIEILADSGTLTVKEMADSLDVSRTAVHRLVETLTSGGYLDQPQSGGVVLSSRWLNLGDAARHGNPDWAGVDDVLDSLAKKSEQTAFLSVPYRGEMLCVAWRPSRGIDLLNYRPGSILPLRKGAAGRVLAAFSTDNGQLQNDEELSEIRERGYAVSIGDVTSGVAAIGVPFFGINGVAVGALSLGGLIDDISSRAGELAQVLTEEADRLH